MTLLEPIVSAGNGLKDGADPDGHEAKKEPVRQRGEGREQRTGEGHDGRRRDRDVVGSPAWASVAIGQVPTHGKLLLPLARRMKAL